MAAPQNVYAFNLNVALAAAERWAKRDAHHRQFEAAAQTKRYSSLDTPERLAARANRLLRKLRDAAPVEAESISLDVAGAEVTPETASDALLERVIGKTRDFLFVEFLEKGIVASRSVGRVVTRLGNGRVSYGTGFMVSPQLLLTNHHVLPSAGEAGQSAIEFNFQRDRFGRDLAVQSFPLDPATFFLNDKTLDFALVAVSGNGKSTALGQYLWCPLRPDAGKIIAGEPINIIQHPKGDRKQVVVRENRLLDSLDDADLFYHYEADTEPGSSGSPVFNDQWEVVALHHSGVPKRNANGDFLKVDGGIWQQGDDPSRLDWVANEGVRISKLVQHVAGAKIQGTDQKRLIRELLDAKAPESGMESIAQPERPSPDPRSTDSPAQTITVTVPIRIAVSLGTPESTAPRVVSIKTESGEKQSTESLLEKVEPDPDYSNRPGYQSQFLGFTTPLPQLTSAIRAQAYALPGESGSDRYELKYYHYSVLFNKERKLAFVAGVNFDPTAKFKHQREKDKWFLDPRVTPEDFQAGEDLYAANPLDRGHLVRRADAGWGKTELEAKLANDDTFHFTNCSPQHAITNQGKQRIEDRGRIIKAPPGLKLWGKLEDHVAAQGKAGRRKLCVFNGPVFRPSDQEYRGVQIPQEFWKVVVFADDSGTPSAVGFVLTQAELIQNLEEEFEVGEYKAVQVRIQELETKTKLDFGSITGWDALEREGAEESFTGTATAVILNSVKDMVL